MTSNYVVVGGGVAGVTCCQTLASTLSSSSDSKVILVAASGLLKGVSNVVKLARFTDTFDVVEQEFDKISGPNTELVQGEAVAIDAPNKKLVLRDGRQIEYEKLCLCTGARPKRVAVHERVLTLRDTESTVALREKLRTARRVLLAGNGGIALELIHEIRDCQVVWAVKDTHLGTAFFDEDAAAFLAPAIASRLRPPQHAPSPAPPSCEPAAPAGSISQDAGEAKAKSEGGAGAGPLPGSSLGPEWVSGALNLAHNPRRLRSKEGFGALTGAAQGQSAVTLEAQCEVLQVSSEEGAEWPLQVHLSNGRSYGCDFLVSAIGVTPNSELAATARDAGGAEMRRDAEGFVEVDARLRSSVPHIFAAGDLCSVHLGGGGGGEQGGEEEGEEGRAWHQMRLWTQARSLGAWAGASMLGQHQQLQPPFELFTHATQFLGFKVVLLGRYNAQGLPPDPARVTAYIRTTPDKEYVKAVLLDGRLVGAVLLGETDLEETFENLILNGFDLSFIGDQLLNPDLDLEDYFD